jgi:hypothetical protein
LIGLNDEKEARALAEANVDHDEIQMKLNQENKRNDPNKANNEEEDNAESPLTRTEQIFQKMDLDKNGVISEYEFINGCLHDKFLYQMLTADYSEND